MQEIWFFLQLLIQGLAVGSVYALVALGFVLIYKASSVINFAQGELLMVGAYVCLGLLTTTQIPFWAAFFLTMAFSIALALLIERLVLRPMIGEPAISIIMITIGLSLVLKSSIAAIWGVEINAFPSIFPETPLKVGEIIVSQVYVFTFLASMVFLVLFALFFKYSRLGIAMRATANSNQVALSMGISVKKVFAISWCVAAVVSAVGGILIGNINGVNITLSSVGLKVFHSGRCPGRADHRRAGEPLRWIPRPVFRRWDQRGRSFRGARDYPHDQTLRPFWHRRDRESLDHEHAAQRDIP